jgi:hypothetical protein
MASNNWTNGSGGNWNGLVNWSLGALPVAADDAFITQNGTYAVLLNIPSTINSLTLGGATGTQTLNISANTLTLNNASTVNSTGILNLAGSTLGGVGSLTFAAGSTFNWTGGTQSGTGITNVNGALKISGDGNKFLTGGRTLNTSGTTTWSGNTNVTTNLNSISLGGNINNSGEWIDQNALSTAITIFSGVGNTFNNSGIYRKIAPNSSAITTIGVFFNNTGTVDVAAGTLEFSNGYTQTAGTTQLNGGAIATSNPLQIQGGSVVGFGTITGNVINRGGRIAPGIGAGAIDN